MHLGGVLGVITVVKVRADVTSALTISIFIARVVKEVISWCLEDRSVVVRGVSRVVEEPQPIVRDSKHVKGVTGETGRDDNPSSGENLTLALQHFIRFIEHYDGDKNSSVRADGMISRHLKRILQRVYLEDVD